MKSKILHTLFLISIFLLSSFSTPHKFYTSITQIEYNPKTQSYEIMMNVFYDDWEKALSEIHQRDIKIEQKDIEKLSLEYLESKFVWLYKTKKLNYKMIGMEQDKDIVKFYLELPHQYIEKGLSIKNDCLLAEFDGQINILNVSLKTQRKTFVFKNTNQFQEIK